MSAHDFSRRTLMSWRPALRDIPPPLRRRWLAMRLRYCAPRVEIGVHYLPPNVRRTFTR
ncbi:hypothetical protein PQR34_45375 [Paraburkholderia sediminicola]|uniref:hypothetical protein n=1 Tax=Paraburkholderia sediminicola TaxID=458836 RepID=UPI0038B8619B